MNNMNKMRNTILLFMAGLGVMTVKAQRPPITPAWAFSHIVWEDSLNNTAGSERLIDAYAKHDIPVDAIIIDSPWSTSYNDFQWDRKRYADPAKMIGGFASKGIRTILWLTGNVNMDGKDTPLRKSASYDYVTKQNYGVNDNSPYVWWKGVGQHIDFTNPKATEWWYSQLDQVFTDGVCGWKVDQGEFWLPKCFNTSVGFMSNQEFRHYYYDAMYDYTVARKKDGVIIARPYSHQGGLAASVEKVNLGWCGDFSGDWNGLKQQIDNIYRSAQYGYGAVGCEVGGFYQKKSSSKQFLRYIQFGCMTACIINGGENGAFSSHLPWYHGTKVCQAYKWCVNFHKELVPYMFSTVVDAHLYGGSLIQKTSVEHFSHLVGRDIFTKAMVSDDDRCEVLLPDEGKWVDFWTGREYNAGESVCRNFSGIEFPLFVRKGAIIPLKITNSVTGMGKPSFAGKRVFYMIPNGVSSQKFYLPVSDGIDYFTCSVTMDEMARSIRLASERPIDCIFIVKMGKKPKAITGGSLLDYKDGKLYIKANGEKIDVVMN